MNTEYYNGTPHFNDLRTPINSYPRTNFEKYSLQYCENYLPCGVCRITGKLCPRMNDCRYPNITWKCS